MNVRELAKLNDSEIDKLFHFYDIVLKLLFGYAIVCVCGVAVLALFFGNGVA